MWEVASDARDAAARAAAVLGEAAASEAAAKQVGRGGGELECRGLGARSAGLGTDGDVREAA